MNLRMNIAKRFNIFGKLSYALEGDDMFFWRLFTERFKLYDGFFIDVGANHPKVYNNTWRLRKLGWRGINIEPSEHIKYFYKYRKDDINLRCLISSNGIENIFYYNKEYPELSFTGGEIRSEYTEKIKVPVKTLAQICKENDVTSIDLLDVDVEGTELDVLESHNWEIKPKVIMCEINDADRMDMLDILKNSETNKFILDKGYKIIGKTTRSMFYQRS